jgi:ABC-2 type transport system ATP-binding protein
VDFLRFAAKVKRVSESRIQETLSRCGIADLRNRRIGNLSKGYRQRVILAQALLGDPDILVLDEPTVGMDPDQVVRVRALIKELAVSKTVLLSTHSLADAYFLCDRVVILDRGRVLAVGTPQGLIHRHEDQLAVLVTVDAPQGEVAGRLEEIPGMVSVERKGWSAPETFLCKIETARSVDAFTTLCSVVSERGWRLHQVAYEMPTLEEVYLRLMAAQERGEVNRQPEKGNN